MRQNSESGEVVEMSLEQGEPLKSLSICVSNAVVKRHCRSELIPMLMVLCKGDHVCKVGIVEKGESGRNA